MLVLARPVWHRHSCLCFGKMQCWILLTMYASRLRYADLHTHTYHSDGTRSPAEVIDVALAHGIEIVAISDHDNLAAYFEIKTYADSKGVTLIPATELSCAYEGVDIHILAYAFDAHDERIGAKLRRFRDARQTRGRRIVERLRALDYNISSERVEQLAAGGAVGRPHVAVALMHATGGVTSIAHPTLYPDHERIVPQLLDAGIDGIEVLHPDVNAEWRETYSNMARFRGKILTGGSDDHGSVKKTETLGTIKVPEEWIVKILDRL
jgi:predicted metal-dependent phosphoesterase TrpH